MERKLASIRRIDDIQPIKKANAIEVATVGGWKSVVKKGEFQIGQTIVYLEIDSFLPIKEQYEFLRPSSYLQLEDGSEGFRLRTVKLRGQVSQGLILPLSVLEGCNNYKFDDKTLLPSNGTEIHSDDRTLYNLHSTTKYSFISLERGTDVTELMDITKYEKPIPAELEGMVKGYIPNQVHKTEEDRIQNLTEDYNEYRKHTYNASEKLDGESFTTFLMDNEFSVCTRNLDLIIPEEYDESLPKHLRYALKHKLEERLRSFGRNIAIQGELIGPGIKKNKYQLEELELYIFNVFNIDTYSYLPKVEAYKIATDLGFKIVPTVEVNLTLPDNVDDLLTLADGKSILNPNTNREGLVLVANCTEERISFKTISNKYLLKGGE